MRSIILFTFAMISMVVGDLDFCAKMTPHCDSPGFKKQCPQSCGGGGGGGGNNNPPPQNPPPQNPSPQNTPNNQPKPSSSGKNCDKRSTCLPLDQCNTNFRQRCEAQGSALKDTCYPHCRYDEDTPTMKKAFLSGPCPLAQLRVYLTAASNGKDNTQCCQDMGVLSQKKTGVCACFCNPTGPVWPGKGEASKYAPCVNVLEGIMHCHQYAEGAN